MGRRFPRRGNSKGAHTQIPYTCSHSMHIHNTRTLTCISHTNVHARMRAHASMILTLTLVCAFSYAHKYSHSRTARTSAPWAVDSVYSCSYITVSGSPQVTPSSICCQRHQSSHSSYIHQERPIPLCGPMGGMCGPPHEAGNLCCGFST